MGIFSNFMKKDITHKRDQAISPPIDDPLLTALFQGEKITRDKAMTLPAVSGNVDFISNMIASMPVYLYKLSQGKIIRKENDNRVKLLNNDTGDTLDGFQFKKAIVEDYLLGKGGYAYIRRYRNEVTGLFYVEDRHISILKNYDPVFKEYKINVNAKTYKPYEFLNKKGFLKSVRKLGQDEINVLKTAWRNLYGNNENNVVVLNNGLEFQEASNSSIEMQLNESKHTLRSEIDHIFHIKTDFYSTFKEAIYPILKAFETALNRDLLLEKEKRNHFFEFDIKEIIKANIKERYESYQMAKNTGFLTINEIRSAENLETIEGLNVVNVGLSSVLYDVDKHIYYTPNTNQATDITGDSESENNKQPEVINKENDEKTDESITNKVNPEGKEEILNENTNS